MQLQRDARKKYVCSALHDYDIVSKSINYYVVITSEIHFHHEFVTFWKDCDKNI